MDITQQALLTVQGKVPFFYGAPSTPDLPQLLCACMVSNIDPRAWILFYDNQRKQAQFTQKQAQFFDKEYWKKEVYEKIKDLSSYEDRKRAFSLYGVGTAIVQVKNELSEYIRKASAAPIMQYDSMKKIYISAGDTAATRFNYSYIESAYATEMLNANCQDEWLAGWLSLNNPLLLTGDRREHRWFYDQERARILAQLLTAIFQHVAKQDQATQNVYAQYFSQDVMFEYVFNASLAGQTKHNKEDHWRRFMDTLTANMPQVQIVQDIRGTNFARLSPEEWIKFFETLYPAPMALECDLTIN